MNKDMLSLFAELDEKNDLIDSIESFVAEQYDNIEALVERAKALEVIADLPDKERWDYDSFVRGQ